MIQVHERVFVGDMSACSAEVDVKAYVHACKSPCHQGAVGYRGKLDPTHPNYLSLRRGDHLYLNLIDPPVPLFKRESFAAFRSFAGEHWRSGRELIIHCNQGESRAPSLALLFMAKDLGALPSESFEAARVDFEVAFPAYRPGQGIVTFLTQAWASL